MKKSFKKLLMLLAVVMLSIIVTPVTAKAVNRNASEVAALKKIIKEQNAAGAKIPEDPTSFCYDWMQQANGEYRLITIRWNNYGITGKVSFSSFPELETIECADNSITKINVKNNKKLTSLTVNNNKLTSLNLTQNPNLTSVTCVNNKLKYINVTECKKLESLYCSNNKLENLNVTKNKSLISLECDNNKLVKLNITKCPKLEILVCNNNKIQKLNASACQNMDPDDIECDDTVKIIGSEE